MISLQEHNKKVQADLLALLQSGNALLMAGAGCSADLGYPDWPGLADHIRTELAPGLQISGGTRPEVVLDLVKKHCDKSNDLKSYYRCIEATLGPKERACGEIHLALVKLGFAGALTTNPDPALGHAIAETLAEAHRPLRSFNLCDIEHRYQILDFFRAVARKDKILDGVLHIHGKHDKPDSCILTTDDYRKWYDGATPNEAGELIDPPTPCVTFHRQVIWSLLAMHSLVFVGYGRDDEFFYKIMQVWRSDFDLSRECPHIAVVGFDGSDESRADLDKWYAQMGIRALYYEVPRSRPKDHSGLSLVIQDLAQAHGVVIGSPGINELTKGFLQL